MKRAGFPLCFAILSISLFVACSGNSPSATATAEKVAQAFISAFEAEQVGDYMALFQQDAIYMDNSNATMRKEGADYIRNYFTYVNYLFQHTNFAYKFSSYFVSPDGRFIALSGTYTNTGKDGKIASVPLQVILEVKDGKIIREDDYYDSSPFY
jgi:ketosteroid isomerase-like protein